MIVSFTLNSANNEFSLLRMRLKYKDNVIEDFNVMVNSNSMFYQTMGKLRNNNFSLDHNGEKAIARMVVPIHKKIASAIIIVYPGAGQNLMQYNKNGVGEISIENISIHLLN